MPRRQNSLDAQPNHAHVAGKRGRRLNGVDQGPPEPIRLCHDPGPNTRTSPAVSARPVSEATGYSVR
jgi:hypothetical protein